MDVLGGWIERAGARGRLLPPPLTQEGFSNESIFLEVVLTPDDVIGAEEPPSDRPA